MAEIQVDEATYARLAEEAAKAGVTVPELIARAVREFVRDAPAAASPDDSG